MQTAATPHPVPSRPAADRRRPPPSALAPFPVHSFRFVLHYVRHRRWAFGGTFALIMGAVSCAVAIQYAVRLLVDAMAGGGDRSAVWMPFILFAALVGTESALWRGAGWLGGKTIYMTGVDIRGDLFRHLSGHAMRYFAEQFAGSLGGRITQTATAFSALMTGFVWAILPPSTDFIGALIVFSTVDWRMTLVLFAFVLVVVVVLAFFGARGRSVHRDYAERASVVGGELIDTVGNIWAVKAFSARERERRRLSEQFASDAQAQVQSWLYLEKSRIIHDVALWVMASTMLAWAIRLWSQGTITPGEVVMVSALTFRILHGSRDLAFALIGTTQQFAHIAETLRVIGRPHDVADAPGALSHPPAKGAIEFREVRFAYPDGRRVFERLSLAIPAGQKVGIAGPSGAGKSTFVSLVQRLDDAQAGHILIDGRPIDGLTQDALRAAIAVVPQEISLFHRSVVENIRYARPDAADEEVFAAARAAYCDEFIRALPQGYDTMVGERGLKLSGGQRQRLGLARAILKNAPIVIFDEATSALDTESEILIQKALVTLMEGRTVLAVAHRLSTLANFDRIIVLSEGRIVEDGSPVELRRSGGVFDSLWRLQADSLTIDADAA